MMFIRNTLQLLLGVVLHSALAQRPLRLDLPLNQEAFVFAHNAATGYLEEKSPFEDLAVGFFKNQVGTFTEQLFCGARAFDLRPAEANGDLFFRHGDRVVTEVSFVDGIRELRDWSRLGTSQGELLLLKIVGCREGDTCNERVSTILDDFGIDFIQDCAEFQNLTVRDALERGPVLAMDGSCFIQNFNDTMNCHGFLPDNVQENVDAVRNCVPPLSEADASALAAAFLCMKDVLTTDKVKTFDCWDDSDSKDFPKNRLFDHLREVVGAGPPPDGKPWQLQALWQVVEDTVTLSIFRPIPLPELLLGLQVTNILKDVEESEINRLVLEFVKELVQNGTILNLVEVDNVCDPFASQLLKTVRPESVSPGTPMPTPVGTPGSTAASTPASTGASTPESTGASTPESTVVSTPSPTTSEGNESSPIMLVSFLILSFQLMLLV